MAKSRRGKEQRQRRRSRETTGEISHKFSESSEMRYDTGQRRSSSERTGSVDPGNAEGGGSTQPGKRHSTCYSLW